MNKLQREQLEIVMEVDRICKKHNIKYLMDAGTMLGAVRHKGFIPWDDDLDICMLREDYDKFSEIVVNELDKKYFYQTNKTDKNFGFFFTKIRKNNTLYLEEMAINNKAHSGIFIDIFPIDNNSDNLKKANRLFKINLIFRMLLLIKCKYKIDTNTATKKIEYIILKACSLVVPKSFIIFIGNRIQLKYKDKDTKNVTSFSTTYFKKCVHEKKWYTNINEYQFENIKLYGTKYYNEFLTYMYNDYMTPPPVEKRENRHGVLRIEYNTKK